MKTINQKRKEAQERNAARQKRSAQEQLDRLDQMLGQNFGAKKEREKLLDEIAKSK